MANYVLAFGELLAGAILLDKGAAAFNSGLSSGTSSTSSSGSSSLDQPVASSGVTAAVQQQAASHGWDAGEVAAWLAVIADESGGNPSATNASSGAYGIAQFINGPSEYSEFGGNADTIAGQVEAMGNYIEQRYGTPSAALAHENSSHWY